MAALITVLTVILFAVLFHYRNYFTGKDKKGNVLLIGILSDRKNFDRRQSIRDTWINLIEGGNISYYFILGNETCGIPPEDRLDIDECEEWLPLDVSNDSVQSEISTNFVDHALEVNPVPTFTGFLFKVHYPIIIKRVSILKAFIPTNSTVNVLLSSSDKVNLTKVTFFAESEYGQYHEHSQTLTKPINQIVLPKGFEGSIELVGGIKTDAVCSYNWNVNNGFVTFTYLLQDKVARPLPYTYQSCTPISFVFSLLDPNSLKTHILEKESRLKVWKNYLQEINEKVVQEVQTKNDIMIVNSPDVYRNLPKKMLTFLKTIYEKECFKYLLKTDDDTFVNVDTVFKSLQHYDMLPKCKTPYLSIWSCFRQLWPVPTVGKWMDKTYISETYPPFPCGSGYVLSRDIVKYFAESAAFLSTEFPGEDTAMGIWLAGLNPERLTYQSSLNGTVPCHWSHDNSYCSSYSCNKAELSIPQMYNTWTTYSICQDMCNCT